MRQRKSSFLLVTEVYSNTLPRAGKEAGNQSMVSSISDTLQFRSANCQPHICIRFYLQEFLKGELFLWFYFVNCSHKTLAHSLGPLDYQLPGPSGTPVIRTTMIAVLLFI